MGNAVSRGKRVSLDEPGWFWHDFPERKWADAVKRLPSEDASRFEEEMRARLRNALDETAAPVAETSYPGRLDVIAARPVISRVLALALPEVRPEPPAMP